MEKSILPADHRLDFRQYRSGWVSYELINFGVVTWPKLPRRFLAFMIANRSSGCCSLRIGLEKLVDLFRWFLSEHDLPFGVNVSTQRNLLRLSRPARPQHLYNR